MTTSAIIGRPFDVLGYDGDVLDRLHAMAEDELAGIGHGAVDEEAAVLRARLRFDRNDGVADDVDKGR